MRSTVKIVQEQVLQYEMVRKSGQAPEESAPQETTVALTHPPLCISRTLGAGARSAARQVCERLRYQLFGRDLIDEIAKDLKVQRLIIDSLDETSRNNLEVMLATFLQGKQIEDLEYKQALFRVVQSLAAQGGVVFLGRGAGCILRGRSALNVLITANLETRVRRVMEYDGLNERQARERVRRFDESRERFRQRMFNLTGHPCEYDLCVNTTRVDPLKASALIFKALEVRGYNLERMRMPAPMRPRGPRHSV